MKDIVTLDAHHTALASQWREQHIRSIGFHHSSNLVESVQENAVDFVAIKNHILHKKLNAADQLTQLLLGVLYVLLRFSRNKDFIFTSARRPGRNIAMNPKKWRRKVNGGLGRRLDQFDVLSGPTTD